LIDSNWKRSLKTGIARRTAIVVLMVAVLCGIAGNVFGAAGDASEPVRYVGGRRADTNYHDGRFGPAIGVQNYQVMRANRSHPEWSDGLGWTYSHAAMLAYWNGKFYYQYLTNPTGEHITPGATMLVTSSDGKNWNLPKVVFPIYFLYNDKADISFSIFMHQRMGFYVAPNGRLLTLAFYRIGGSKGIGRVVREIYKDGGFGPLYFIRLNADWKGKVLYPMYTRSKDKGFVDACQDLLSNRRMTQQWVDEDELAPDRKDIYPVPWFEEDDPPSSFCYYVRKDGKYVGLFKKAMACLSDDGRHWSVPVRCETMGWRGAKVWGQKTDDGRYALVFDHTFGSPRHPLSVMTSDDGIIYDNIANVHAEVSPKKYWGREKRPGPQYMRGIMPGNGDPPDDDVWVAYSVCKEDMWISRIGVPVRLKVRGPVNDDFSKMESGGVVTDWNIYCPKWCRTEVVDFPSKRIKSLMLSDKDPYDYAKAVRVFENTGSGLLSFKLYVECAAQVLDIEVVGREGDRLIQTRFDTDGSVKVKKGDGELALAARIKPRTWHTVEIELNSQKNQFGMKLNGKTCAAGFDYSADGKVGAERIVFRTGDYRLGDEVVEYKSGSADKPGWDEPGSDEPVEKAVYYIRDFRTVGSGGGR